MPVSFKRMRPMLGTFVEIGCTDQCGNAELAVNTAFTQIAHLQDMLSFHAADSELTKINEAKGGAVSVHRHTLRVIKLARAMMVASKGLFNCTVGGAMVRQNLLPDHGGDRVAEYGDATDIVINRGTVQLKKSVKVTLDGIAKGYAVDCAIAMLKHLGVTSGWVNAGGDLRVYGSKVLPVHRRELDGQYVELGGIQNAALATSVISKQYDQALPGKVVSHLAIPQAGAWSVMAHSAWRADALTKVACLANANEREDLITALGGVLVYPQLSSLNAQ